MDQYQRLEFESAYSHLRTALDALPQVIDDPVAYRETVREMKTNLAKLDELLPPATDPL